MNRRQLLTRIVGGFSLVAAAGISVPFLRSWFPSFRQETFLDIDVTDMAPGDYRKVRWLGRTVYVVNRSASTVEDLKALDDNRADADSSESSQPAFAENRFRSLDPSHLLVYANCTHLGCEVEVIDEEGSAGFAGFRCPCHRSEFDAAGRVEQGAAARLNLEVPEYSYAGQGVIRLVDIQEDA